MVENHAFANKQLKERYELLAKHYNNRLHEHIPNHTKILSPFIELLKKNHINPKVIDLGCGVGLNSLILENNGINVLGLDYSENSIKHAKNNCSKSNFITADFLDWAPTEKFHGVVAGSFLDKFHPELIPELINRIDSLLVPKGYGLVYMPLTKEKNPNELPAVKENYINPYVALIERDKWFQSLSNNFKVVNYYEGYGSRDWFISIFQKK